MSGHSQIEWTDATWNPVGGCSIKSPGCGPCYAQRLAGTRLRNHPLYRGTTDKVKDKHVFNGMMTAAPDYHPVWTFPLRWNGVRSTTSTRPVMGILKHSLIFAGDMADVTHEDRPIWAFRRMLAIASISRHIVQFLTKRPDVMAAAISAICIGDYPCSPWHRLLNDVEQQWLLSHPRYWDEVRPILLRAAKQRGTIAAGPLPNVWLGFSAERQPEFDQRWPHMRALAQAGWTIFLSYEPAIGPLDLPADFLALGRRAQVIAGGMSGPEATPSHPDWFRRVRDQCAAASVPFFFKQWGEWAPYDRGRLDSTALATPKSLDSPMSHVGKKIAGRLLDGVEHNGFPIG